MNDNLVEEPQIVEEITAIAEPDPVPVEPVIPVENPSCPDGLCPVKEVTAAVRLCHCKAGDQINITAPPTWVKGTAPYTYLSSNILKSQEGLITINGAIPELFGELL